MSCFSNKHQRNTKKTLPFIIFSCCKRRDFLCNHSDGDLFTVIIKCEDIMFLREMYYNKINFQKSFPAFYSRFTRNEIDRRSSRTLLQQFSLLVNNTKHSSCRKNRLRRLRKWLWGRNRPTGETTNSRYYTCKCTVHTIYLNTSNANSNNCKNSKMFMKELLYFG